MVSFQPKSEGLRPRGVHQFQTEGGKEADVPLQRQPARECDISVLCLFMCSAFQQIEDSSVLGRGIWFTQSIDSNIIFI